MNRYCPTEKICRNGNAAWKIVFDKLWDGNRMTFLTHKSAAYILYCDMYFCPRELIAISPENILASQLI